ncbi:MAG: amidase [Chloroflexi bacterium]|nr:MAG: amidase [Chloroflexota bacterium]
MRRNVLAILTIIMLIPSVVVARTTALTGNTTNTAPTAYNEFTVAQLQAEMAGGRLTSVQLTQYYLDRIAALDQSGPNVNSVIELNPDALKLARSADNRRAQGKVIGPLDGIPVLLKDNIDTGDRMQTTAGSFALAGKPAVDDSTVAANLRAAGAVILGKTNLSEWANFRSFFSTSGWSGRGGLTHNPYSTDRNACGSSSGSAAAAGANFAAISVGTETDGSIVCPANVSAVVGIKPTVGLASRAGIVPISHTQDTPGPHARTVADAAALLNVLAARTPDPRDAATSGVPLGWQGTGRARPALPADYTAFLNADGLRGTRIGVTRQGIDNGPPQVVAAFDNAIASIQSAGATVVDLDGAGFTFAPADGEFLVLVYDFKIDLQKYFATRVGVPMANKTLADAIAFNNANASTEMPYFFQEIFELAQSMDISGPNPGDNPQAAFGGMTYNQALAIDHNAGANGIDKALSQFHLDAVVAPTDSPGWTTDLIMSDHFVFASSGLAGGPGYPIVQVPAANVLGMPMGISFLGTAFSEPTLIKLASGFEAKTHARTQPTFTGNITTANTNGTTLQPPKPPKNAMGMRPHRV